MLSSEEWSSEEEFTDYSSESTSQTCTPLPIEEKEKKKPKNPYGHYDIPDDEMDSSGKDFQMLKSPKTGELRVITPINLDNEDKQRELGRLIMKLRISTMKRREEEEQKRQELQQKEELRQQNIKKHPVEITRSPPIYVYNVDPIELKNICKFAIDGNFLIDLMSKDVYIVHCYTMEQYETIQKILELSNKEFSLTARENVYRRMALYGLASSTPTTELLNTLKQHECDHLKFINVKFFRTRRGPGYIVNISFDSRVDLLKNIDTINNQPVTWEAYILQCYNCQEYGHRGSRCRFEPQCVKCAKQHLSSDCPIKKEGFVGEQFKCAICNVRGHTADSPQCSWLQCTQRQLMYKGQPFPPKPSEEKCDKELSEFMCTMAEQMNSVYAQMQSLTEQMELISAEVGKRWLKNSQPKD